MAALDIGRLCIKTAGREAGRYCVIIKKVDDNFVFVTGPKMLTGVKRRQCNIEHLEPTEHMLKVKADASEKEVIESYKAANLLSPLGLGQPSPEVVKEAEKKVKEQKKEEAKEEEKPKKEEKPKEEKKEEKPAKKTEKKTKKAPAKGKGKKK